MTATMNIPVSVTDTFQAAVLLRYAAVIVEKSGRTVHKDKARRMRNMARKLETKIQKLKHTDHAEEADTPFDTEKAVSIAAQAGR